LPLSPTQCPDPKEENLRLTNSSRAISAQYVCDVTEDAVKTAVFVLLACSLAGAQKGTLTTHTTVWNGLTRTYEVYTPPVLQTSLAMVMVLHGTTVAAENDPPLTVYHAMGWDQLADTNGFLVIQPISTWKPIPSTKTGGVFFWESFGTDTYFPTPPDDSGFLANLAAELAASHGVDAARVFVMGFSSGGMMTQRMCIEHADLFAACAPLSGPVWIGNSGVVLPQPAQPVSVLEMHGDADTTIPYCGGTFSGWGEGNLDVPSVDVDVNYWLAADGLPKDLPLCGKNNIATRFEVQRASPSAEVQFLRESGFGHTYHQSTIAIVWEFFSTHGRM
jgi:polyhydroxybutyrate depolymerase